MMTVASDSGRQPRGIRPVFPPLLKQMYKCGWPGADVLKSVHEQFLLQRAVQSYMMTLPTLNVIGLRDGSEAEFGAGYNVLPIWKDRMDSRALVPTPACLEVS